MLVMLGLDGGASSGDVEMRTRFVYADGTETYNLIEGELTSSSPGMSGCVECHVGSGVTSIGAMAFLQSSTIKTVTLPDSVRSIGTMAFAFCQLSSITMPGALDSIGQLAFGNCGIEEIDLYNVAELEENVFQMCHTLKRVSISGTAETLPTWTFMECESLESVEITAAVKTVSNAFYECTSLKSVTLPDSVETIEAFAFYDCPALTSFTVPSGVSTIQTGAFRKCKLSTISVAPGNTHYDSRDGCNCVIETATNKLVIGSRSAKIPASVRTIGEYAFSAGCPVAIAVPTGVTTIEPGAFTSSYLYCLHISETVTSMSATMACPKMHLLSFAGETAPTITDGTFSGLGEVADYSKQLIAPSTQGYSTGAYATLVSSNGFTKYDRTPSGAAYTSNGQTIYDHNYSYIQSKSFAAVCDTYTAYDEPQTIASAFYGNTNLTYVCLDTSRASSQSEVRPLAGEVGNLISIQPSSFMGCTSLSTVLFPTSRTDVSIMSSAFRGCDSLTSIVLTNYVTALGASAFQDCHRLKSISIPSSITAIEASTFQDCTQLETVTLNNVTSIGANAFTATTSLSNINLSKVTSLGAGVFSRSGIKSATIKCAVPNSAFAQSGLETVTLYGTSIGSYAFSTCGNLREIYVYADCTASDSAFGTDRSTYAGINVTTGKTFYTMVNYTLTGAAWTDVLLAADKCGFTRSKFE